MIESTNILIVGERAPIARMADYPGFIPIIGNVVGLIRVICGLAFAILNGLLGLCNLTLNCIGIENNKSSNNFINASLSLSEFSRGLTELFFLSWICHRTNQSSEINQRELAGIASGRYYYHCPRHGGIFFSQSNDRLHLNQYQYRINQYGIDAGTHNRLQLVPHASN